MIQEDQLEMDFMSQVVALRCLLYTARIIALISCEQRRWTENKITITYRGTGRDKQRVNVPSEQADSGTKHRRANEKTEHDSHTYNDNHTYTHTYTNIQIDT